MADLEKLALKRDRGYLVRLVLLLVAGGVAASFVYGFLTGSRASGCLSSAIGAEHAPETEPKPQ